MLFFALRKPTGWPESVALLGQKVALNAKYANNWPKRTVPEQLKVCLWLVKL